MQRKRVTFDGVFIGSGWILTILLFFGVMSFLMPSDAGQKLFGVGCTAAAVAYYFWHKRNVNYEVVPPTPRDPSSPSTPEETKQAHNHLRVALAFRKEAFAEKNNHAQLHKIGQAGIALAKARSLDPNLTITDTEDEPFAFTQDNIAADLLYLESQLLFKQADASAQDAINAIGTDRWNDGMKFHQKTEKETLQKALNAIERALKYNPTSALYHCELAKIHSRLGNTKHSKAAMNRALEIAPDDIDVLKLSSQLG